MLLRHALNTINCLNNAKHYIWYNPQHVPTLKKFETKSLHGLLSKVTANRTVRTAFIDDLHGHIYKVIKISGFYRICSG